MSSQIIDGDGMNLHGVPHIEVNSLTTYSNIVFTLAPEDCYEMVLPMHKKPTCSADVCVNDKIESLWSSTSL